jgi:hypothetical protein
MYRPLQVLRGHEVSGRVLRVLEQGLHGVAHEARIHLCCRLLLLRRFFRLRHVLGPKRVMDAEGHDAQGHQKAQACRMAS